MTRDYRKFLGEDGRFNPKLVPRKDYTAMINDYRKREPVIREVFGKLYWLWDVENLKKEYEEAGEEVPFDELAQEVMHGMDDDDWWQTIGAFELHFIEHFNDDVSQWYPFLDHVYDDQEQAGWTLRQ